MGIGPSFGYKNSLHLQTCTWDCLLKLTLPFVVLCILGVSTLVNWNGYSSIHISSANAEEVLEPVPPSRSLIRKPLPPKNNQPTTSNNQNSSDPQEVSPNPDTQPQPTKGPTTEKAQEVGIKDIVADKPIEDLPLTNQESENAQSEEQKKEKSQNADSGVLATIRSALSAIGLVETPQTAPPSPESPSTPQKASAGSASTSTNTPSSSFGLLLQPGTQATTPTPSTAAPKNQRRKWTESPSIKKLVSKEPPTAPVPPPPLAPPAPPIGTPSIGVPPPHDNWIAYHVLRRATFGGTPNQLNTVAALSKDEARAWATRFLKTQLELDPNLPWPTNLQDTSPLPSPIPINDSRVNQLLQQDRSDWKFEKGENHVYAPSLAQLQDQDLIRKFYSERQLLEKMVYFWDNHFNTNFQAHDQGQYELAENEAYRAHAFGQFTNLLMANGKSPAMMIYLNTTGNRKEEPNENYIREMLELHTLGVDQNGIPNGYTQQDIVEGAKTFTGWNKTSGKAGGFRFISSHHSSGSKVVLGQSIPFDGNGPSEGERVLQLAARHPSTAQHLAQKLCEYFVSDTPSPRLVRQVASVFRASDGNIKKVLIAIFTSPEFNDVSNYLVQVKTPLEFVVGIYRNLNVWSSRDPFRKRMTIAGQSLFEMPVPTGYPEQAKDWVNTHVLFHEVSFGFETAISGFGSNIRFGTDVSGGGRIRVWLQQLGLSTEEEILGFLLNLTVDRQVTESEYQIYLNTMREGLGGKPFDITNSSREKSLDRLLATIINNPRYAYQ